MATKKAATRKSAAKKAKKSASKGYGQGVDPCNGVSLAYKGDTLAIKMHGDQNCVATIKVTCGRRVCTLQRCVWNGSSWDCSGRGLGVDG